MYVFFFYVRAYVWSWGKTPPEGDSTVVVDDPPAWEPANAPRRGGNDGEKNERQQIQADIREIIVVK